MRDTDSSDGGVENVERVEKVDQVGNTVPIDVQPEEASSDTPPPATSAPIPPPFVIPEITPVSDVRLEAKLRHKIEIDLPKAAKRSHHSKKRCPTCSYYVPT